MPVIGQPVPRVDALDKVTGEQKYLADLQFPDMLYGAILRSPYAHARVVSIDTSEAENIPGVRAVITAKDTPGLKFSFIQALADKLPLAADTVRYVGDEVAAVAADNPDIANEALEHIRVEYEPLPAVFDPEQAMRPGTPLVHPERGSNITFEVHKKYGSPEEGFGRADLVFTDRFTTQRVAHCCMETRGCIARFDRTGRLTVWSPTQAPHTLRQELARVLGIDRSQVNVIRTSAGGGFGSRLVMDMKEPIAALLSKKTGGRPVKIVNTRTEEFMTSRTRYPYIIDLRTGVTRDGRIVAREVRIIVDNGAYNDKGPGTLNFAAAFFTALYAAPYIKFDGYVVYTNHEFGTAFRGFGNPQIHFATESQMDMIAEKLGMDPIELRLKNANRPHTHVASGALITSCGLEECIRRAAAAAGWEDKRRAYPAFSKDAVKRRGIGAAVMVHSGGGSRYYGYNATDAFVKISEDGRITVITPAVEIGQGASTAMAQIAAEVLGVDVNRISVYNADTFLTPYDLGAFGSRTTFVCGNAVKDAAEDARREILAVAAEMLQTESVQLDIHDSCIWQGSEAKLSFDTVVQYAFEKKGRPLAGRGRYSDPKASGTALTGDDTIPTYAFACQVAEVEVDMETGNVKVLKVTAAHDTGRTINPVMAAGQVEGAILQGLGYALTEELKTIEGRILNASFTDYKTYRSQDAPEIEVILVESNDPAGPFGAKGIGEPGLVPTPAAVANAIYHATGIRVKSLPMTPDRLLNEFRKAAINNG